MFNIGHGLRYVTRPRLRCSFGPTPAPVRTTSQRWSSTRAGRVGYSALYPGGPAQPVDFSITNTGDQCRPRIRSVTISLLSAALSSGLPDATWFYLIQPTCSSSNVTIAAGATSIFSALGFIDHIDKRDRLTRTPVKALDIPLTFTSNVTQAHSCIGEG